MFFCWNVQKVKVKIGAMIEDDLFKKVLARYIIDKNLVDYAKKLSEEEK